jgi:hypothetical protein
VFDADAGDTHVACLAGLAEGVVAAVEVFALLALYVCALVTWCRIGIEKVYLELVL